MNKPIRRVSVLVHPFYALVNREENDKIRLRTAFKHLSGVWGKKIREVAQDPHAILIFVSQWKSSFTIDPNWRMQVRDGEGRYLGLLSDTWFYNRIAKFEEHARRVLGDRFFFCSAVINGDDLMRTIRKRGFHLDPKLKGESFGEYWKYCVGRSTRLAERVLGLRENSIVENPSLSVAFPVKGKKSHGTLDPKNKTMGPFHPYLPKAASRRSRKRARGK